MSKMKGNLEKKTINSHNSLRQELECTCLLERDETKGFKAVTLLDDVENDSLLLCISKFHTAMSKAPHLGGFAPALSLC